MPVTKSKRSVVRAKPNSIFQTFTSKNAKLDDGVCIIRNLGGGKYEIVNLQKVACEAISSEENGRLIKSVPERRAILDLDHKSWEEVKLKCYQGVRSADSDIFRFLKLPIELRYKIYDYVLTTEKTISRRGRSHTMFNSQFIQTCRQIREEGMPFLYRNNFYLTVYDDSSYLNRDTSLWNNLQELSFQWLGFANKDKHAFEVIAQLPKLKILHVVITRHVVNSSCQRRQKLHQDEDNAKPFRSAAGFDQLVQIRGLERVKVDNSGSNPPLAPFSEDKDKFELFLNEVLTQPKPEPRAKRATKPRKARKSNQVRELEREVENLI